MEILIEDRQSRHRIDHQAIENKAKRILDALGCPDGELSILMVDDAEIAGMNESYLGRPKPTNVIAFPMQEGPYKEVNPGLLGDVVISLDTAAREARDGHMSLESRFDQLLIHGILHLAGYEDTTGKSRKIMREKENELLQKIRKFL